MTEANAADERFAFQNLQPSCNVLGIDLGTTNTVVAVWVKGKPSPEVITVENNERIIPSYVWFKEDRTTNVGKKAQRNVKGYPQDVCYDAKRMIGQSFNDFMILQQDYWSFKIVNNEGRPAYELSDGRKISPEEITSLIIKEAKRVAEKYVGGVLEYAGITVPVQFSQAQKQATLEAAKEAGIKVLQLETEITAVAYAYCLDHKRSDDYNLFIFDLGSGNVNVAIISVKNGECKTIASAGDTRIGGRDFDNLLIKELKIKLKKFGQLKYNDVQQKVRLRVMAESTKVALTTCDREAINCSDLIKDSLDDIQMIEVTIEEFKNLSSHLLSLIKYLCKKVLTLANMTANDIDTVIPIGGASRMAMINELLEELFPATPDQKCLIRRALNCDDAVAYGAAIRAAQLSNPIYSNYDTNLLPIGMGIKFSNDHYSVIIKSGTKYSVKSSRKRYYTTENDQLTATFLVCEGDHPNQARELMTLTINDLPPGIASEVYIDVEFVIDKNGLLEVIAKSPNHCIEESVDYKKTTPATQTTLQFFRDLNLKPKNDHDVKNLVEARIQLRKNIENIKNRCQNEKYFSQKRRQTITENCNIVIEWLDKHVGERVDEEIIYFSRKIENDVNIDQQETVLFEDRIQLRIIVEEIKEKYQKEKNIPHNRKMLMIANCDEVIEWFDEHPGEVVDEEIIDLAKLIKRDVENL